MTHTSEETRKSGYRQVIQDAQALLDAFKVEKRNLWKTCFPDRLTVALLKLEQSLGNLK